MLKKICLIMLSFFLSLSGARAAQTVDLSFEEINTIHNQSEAILPLYLNTNGEKINAIQIKLNLTGAAIENLDFYLNEELNLQIILDNIDENNLFLMLAPKELDGFIQTEEKTELLSLSFSTLEEGELLIAFNQDDTLTASLEDSSNLLANLSNKTLAVKNEVLAQEVAADSVSIEPTKVVDPESTAPLAEKQNSSLIYWLVIAFVVLALTVIFLTQFKKKKVDLNTMPIQEPPANPPINPES